MVHTTTIETLVAMDSVLSYLLIVVWCPLPLRSPKK